MTYQFRMKRMYAYFVRFWRWTFRRRTQNTELRQQLIPRDALDFEFKPATSFLACLGANTRFVVANPLDLILQERGLMAEALVVEVITSERKFVFWFRYNAEDLSKLGASQCTLFANDADRVFDGVCGVICRSKQI